MIDLHFWPTPNGHKITLALEEMALDYRLVPVDLQAGAQHQPGFLAISPNNRMPAIVDRAPSDGGDPVAIFESGAILLYLARKSGKLLGADLRQEKAVLEWLFWQVGGHGPMAGQHYHFTRSASEQVPYAIDRFTQEVARLHRILDGRLEGTSFVAGVAFSVADCAIYPWLRTSADLGGDFTLYPNIRRYLGQIGAREATARAYARSDQMVRDLKALKETEA
jgi:GST-like protein